MPPKALQRLLQTPHFASLVQCKYHLLFDLSPYWPGFYPLSPSGQQTEETLDFLKIYPIAFCDIFIKIA